MPQYSDNRSEERAFLPMWRNKSFVGDIIARQGWDINCQQITAYVDVCHGKDDTSLTAGVLHHCAVQYPQQQGLYTTLFAFALSNSVFLVLEFLYSSRSLIWKVFWTLTALIQFNIVYVRASFNVLISRLPVHSP
jgi:hypothetical protein